MKSGDAHLAAVEHEVRPAPPTTRSKSEARARTRDLIGGLGGATTAERQVIRDEVVTLHLWLASAVTRRFGSAYEYEDLLQVARIGLIEAFDRFDPAQSSYSNFAWLTMTGLLQRHLRDLGWSVRPPRSLQESANKLRGSVPQLTQDLGRTPTELDVARHLGWTPAEVREAQVAEQGMRPVSVDALVDAGWAPEQPSDWDQIETRLLLERALHALSDEERQLLRLRFLDELSQAKIATVLGTTQMGVSRRLVRLLTRLRSEIGDLGDAPTRPAGTPAYRPPSDVATLCGRAG